MMLADNTSRKKIHNRSKSESDLSISFKSNKKEDQKKGHTKAKKTSITFIYYDIYNKNLTTIINK